MPDPVGTPKGLHNSAGGRVLATPSRTVPSPPAGGRGPATPGSGIQPLRGTDGSSHFPNPPSPRLAEPHGPEPRLSVEYINDHSFPSPQCLYLSARFAFQLLDLANPNVAEADRVAVIHQHDRQLRLVLAVRGRPIEEGVAQD